MTLEVTSEFLQRLNERGFIHQATDMAALDALMSGGACVPAYIGFDCTAPSLHVGSLMQIMILRHLQQCGHKPIVLLGGFTTKIGDPSGKDASRNALDDATIAKNKAGIQSVFEKFLRFGDGEADAVLVDNDDWLGKMNLGEFLRNVGSKFSVNRMVKMDSVRLRLERENHLSFLEFSYMLMQSYDFVELNKRYGCRLQIGGADQWGNIVQGVDLCFSLSAVGNTDSSFYYTNNDPDLERLRNKVSNTANLFQELKHKLRDLENHESDDMVSTIEREILENSKMLDALFKKENRELSYIEQEQVRESLKNYPVFGVTTPLLTTSSGAKMGKTADGAVWLNADMLSAYDYWQFWRNTEDSDVGRFLKLFTELPLEEIARLEALEGAGINEAKKVLATEATALLHGRVAAEQAAETARKTFEEGASDANLPTVTLSVAEVGASVPAFKLFHLAGLANSGAEARRLIQGGGARSDDAKVEDENAPITLAIGLTLKLSAGKKKHVRVVVV